MDFYNGDKVRALVGLLRPEQWVKNGFVFLPLFFSGRLLDGSLWMMAILAFVAFSLAASSIYCLNDVKDVEADRAHPVKCRRPVASGAVTPREAVLLMGVLTAGWIGLAWAASGSLAVVVGAYVLMNVGYCFGLKHVAILDVFIIATGFVLRIVAGGMATGIVLSPWIVCLTFLLALFLAFAKRRDDVVLRERKGVAVRRNTEHYNLPFLNQTLGVLAAVMLVCYIMYTVSPAVTARLHTDYLYVTSVFVLAGILRYLQVAIVGERSGSPTKVLLHDRFTQICLLGWIVSFAVIIY